MKKKIYLPKSIEELRKMSKDKQRELWGRYYRSEYKKQVRSLWYEIRCENRKERIKKKYMDRIRRYIEIGVERVIKKRYRIEEGTEIVKIYKGKEYKVIVGRNYDFLYKGKVYKSLSGIGKEITGQRVSGIDFFGINNKRVIKVK